MNRIESRTMLRSFPQTGSAVYFAARSFGRSVSWMSGTGGAAGAVGGAAVSDVSVEKRAINQERKRATASLLRSSGWVVR